MIRKGFEKSEQRVLAGGKLFKVLVVGNSFVGKSHIIHRYAYGEQPDSAKIEATVALAFHKKDLTI